MQWYSNHEKKEDIYQAVSAVIIVYAKCIAEMNYVPVLWLSGLKEKKKCKTVTFQNNNVYHFSLYVYGDDQNKNDFTKNGWGVC